MVVPWILLNSRNFFDLIFICCDLQDLDALYGLYDKDNSGTLDYREFASEIFGRDVGGTPARGRASGEDLLQRLRDKLKTRGARGIIGLAK